MNESEFNKSVAIIHLEILDTIDAMWRTKKCNLKSTQIDIIKSNSSIHSTQHECIYNYF